MKCSLPVEKEACLLFRHEPALYLHISLNQTYIHIEMLTSRVPIPRTFHFISCHWLRINWFLISYNLWESQLVCFQILCSFILDKQMPRTQVIIFLTSWYINIIQSCNIIHLYLCIPFKLPHFFSSSFSTVIQLFDIFVSLQIHMYCFVLIDNIYKLIILYIFHILLFSLIKLYLRYIHLDHIHKPFSLPTVA